MFLFKYGGIIQFSDNSVKKFRSNKCFLKNGNIFIFLCICFIFACIYGLPYSCFVLGNCKFLPYLWRII